MEVSLWWSNSRSRQGKLTIAPLLFAVSWYLSMIDLTQGVSPVLYRSAMAFQMLKRHLSSHINIMRPSQGTRFHHGCRVQVVGSHRIDNQLRLADEGV